MHCLVSGGREDQASQWLTGGLPSIVYVDLMKDPYWRVGDAEVAQLLVRY